MRWTGLVILVGLIGYFLMGSLDSDPMQKDRYDSGASSGHGESIGEKEPSVRLIDGNPFVEEYGQPDRNTANDLTVVNLLLSDSQLLIKDFDSYFLPENRQITGFLQGKNRDRLAWIPEQYRFVNDQGELVDRWETPLFFHRKSGFQFELRSAGPDRKLWTKDDITTQPKSAN